MSAFRGCVICGQFFPYAFLFHITQIIKGKEYKIVVCDRCYGSNHYQEHINSLGGEKGMTRKLNLNTRLWCPSCSNHTATLDGGCWSPTCKFRNGRPVTEPLTHSQWLKQRLEFAEYMCPFCHEFNIDTDNKICLSCKKHLSKKSMLKQYQKALHKKETDANLIVPCTICKGGNTWPELYYCFDCKQVFQMVTPDKEEWGFIDGKPTGGYIYIKAGIQKGAVDTYKFSFGVPLQGVEEVTGMRSGTNLGDVKATDTKDNKEFLKISSQDFEDLQWEDETVTIDNATITVKVRYLVDEPELLVVKEYSVDDFSTEVLPLISSLLKTKLNK